jgi:hypothetical protein
MKTRPFLTLFLATAVQLPAAEKWIPLFDGRSLDGWTQRGGKATYRVEDGCVVGTTVPNTPNSFLCTDRHYSDFILEYEFKVDPSMNSGVQIRSHCFDVPYQLPRGEKPVKIAAGRVHGYQVEIDPAARAWTAGIYDEGRRGWLDPADGQQGERGKAFTEQGRKSFKQGEWNHVRVEARGDSIKTWLNGTPAADLRDDLTASGFIALQVHGVGKREEPMEVRWRSIRLQDLSRQNADVLFNGRSLEAWQTGNGGAVSAGWEVKDGTLHRAGKGGDIFSKKEYGDFELDLEWKISEGGNSGIKYRVAQFGKAWLGPEYQVLDDDQHPDGKLREGRRKTGGLYDVFVADGVKVLQPPGQWNHTRIIARGTKVQHWLNGYKVLEYDTTSEDWQREIGLSKFAKTDGFGVNAKGHIMLQDHNDEVWYRDITVRELK